MEKPRYFFVPAEGLTMSLIVVHTEDDIEMLFSREGIVHRIALDYPQEYIHILKLNQIW